jgi:pimeloyl-ACP methyl ester carboxylesterase
MAHEYLYVHRAFRQLATQLSRAGFHAFRFDYFGFGDSAGASEESNIERWVQDISTTIYEAKSLCGVSTVSLIGFRLGATAAALAAAQRTDVENLLLWEPVIGGSEYVKELLALQSNWLDEYLPANSHPVSFEETPEVLGMPFPHSIRAALERTDLMKLQKRLAKNVLVIEDESIDGKSLAALQSLGEHVECQRIRAISAWTKNTGMDAIYVPGPTLNLIVSWMARMSQ